MLRSTATYKAMLIFIVSLGGSQALAQSSYEGVLDVDRYDILDEIFEKNLCAICPRPKPKPGGGTVNSEVENFVVLLEGLEALRLGDYRTAGELEKFRRVTEDIRILGEGFRAAVQDVPGSLYMSDYNSIIRAYNNNIQFYRTNYQ